MDTDRPDDEARDEPTEWGASSEPVEYAVGIDDAVVAEPEPRSRFVLATLAGIVVAVVGIAVWSLLYVYLERNYVGVAVVFALGIGYVVREVSRRADLRARILASLLTVLLCAVGALTAEVANTARQFKQPFVRLWTDVAPDIVDFLSELNVWTHLIFVAAIVVAFLSAGPAKPKQPKQSKAAPAARADEDDDEPGPSEPGF